MARYQMVVMSDPVEGREAQYNRWYEDVHLPELLALEGICSARRLRCSRTLGERDAYAYLVIYEIETDDIDGVLQNLVSTAMAGQFAMSDAIDSENSYAAVYEDLGPLVKENE